MLVWGYGGIGDPGLEEHVSGVGAQGLVRFFHELGAGDVRPGGGRVCSTSGRRGRPSCGSWVRCARALTGRCFLKGGEGVLRF